MRKKQLLDLIDSIRAETGLERIVVTGSQTVHAVTQSPPDIAVGSIEADILLIGPDFRHKTEIALRFGIDSPYLAEHGCYADPIGPGIVALPKDWERRTVEVRNPAGSLNHVAVEIHDAASAKLMAGREKDLRFLTDLLRSGLLGITEFLARFDSLRQSPSANAVDDRLRSLESACRKAGLPDAANAIGQHMKA